MVGKLVAGLVGAPFGLNGFVKVRSLSGEIDHLLKLQAVTVRLKGTERLLHIEESAAAPPGVHMRFAGFDSPEAARTLSGAELLVDREQASPLQDGEFYIEDLKGLAVVAGPDADDAAGGIAGGILGHITDIVEGNGDIAEIRLLSGELKLVPFRKDFFSGISLEKGRIELRNLWILE